MIKGIIRAIFSRKNTPDTPYKNWQQWFDGEKFESDFTPNDIREGMEWAVNRGKLDYYLALGKEAISRRSKKASSK